MHNLFESIFMPDYTVGCFRCLKARPGWPPQTPPAVIPSGSELTSPPGRAFKKCLCSSWCQLCGARVNYEFQLLLTTTESPQEQACLLVPFHLLLPERCLGFLVPRAVGTGKEERKNSSPWEHGLFFCSLQSSKGSVLWFRGDAGQMETFACSHFNHPKVSASSNQGPSDAQQHGLEVKCQVRSSQTDLVCTLPLHITSCKAVGDLLRLSVLQISCLQNKGDRRAFPIGNWHDLRNPAQRRMNEETTRD